MTSNQTFEQAYAELNAVIDQLESGQLSLEQSVALYERGRALVAFCQAQLESAELRINTINGESASTLRQDDLQ
ncbi:MAG: hypothetical protein OHK0023_05590 [Anaerolineae bacterium]